ncbi:MAG: hypothetical protein ACE5ID_07760 [Acidobacteriota bacterium]
MKKLQILLFATSLLLLAAANAQAGGEVLGAAVINLAGDAFECYDGTKPCGLRHRTYSEADASDFFGAANPVDGYPRYTKTGRYLSDPQITSNYPASQAGVNLNWYSVWDGVVGQDNFAHVGYYGAQSQVISFGEIGNPKSPTCLPVIAQTACFLALSSWQGNTLDGFGPAGTVGMEGGLAPIPRPVVTFVDATSIQFDWEEAAAATIQDGAPHPIQGYKMFLVRRSRTDRLGPSENEIVAAAGQGQLIDLTPGTFIPRTTTSFLLSASDPLLASYDPAAESLVAVLQMVYAQNVLSTHYSANSFPVTFTPPEAFIHGFQARVGGNRVVLSWTADNLSGIRSFNVLVSDGSSGPYFPINRQDINVNGARGSFTTIDRLNPRPPLRARAGSRFYRLELTRLDGTHSLLFVPLEVDVRSVLRGNGQR